MIDTADSLTTVYNDSFNIDEITTNGREAINTYITAIANADLSKPFSFGVKELRTEAIEKLKTNYNLNDPEIEKLVKLRLDSDTSTEEYFEYLDETFCPPQYKVGKFIGYAVFYKEQVYYSSITWEKKQVPISIRIEEDGSIEFDIGRLVYDFVNSPVKVKTGYMQEYYLNSFVTRNLKDKSEEKKLVDLIMHNKKLEVTFEGTLPYKYYPTRLYCTIDTVSRTIIPESY